MRLAPDVVASRSPNPLRHIRFQQRGGLARSLKGLCRRHRCRPSKTIHPNLWNRRTGASPERAAVPSAWSVMTV